MFCKINLQVIVKLLTFVMQTTNMNTTIYVTANHIDHDLYVVKMESGNTSTSVEVDAIDIIEWTDSKGYTFGFSDDGLLTEPRQRGYTPRGEDTNEWIKLFLSPNDWQEFAATLPAYKEMPTGKATSKLLSKYNSLRREDGIAPKIRSTVYPPWWAYDKKGKWVMVEGEKVHVSASELGDYMISQQFFDGKDEQGYYLKDYGRGRVYLDPRQCLHGWDNKEWWDYSQTILSQAA